VIWIFQEIARDDTPLRLALTAARRFLNHTISIQEIMQARAAAWDQFNFLRDAPLGEVSSADLVVRAVMDALKVCCQRQMEETHDLVREKRQVEAESVAIHASHAAARYAAGSAWNTPDKTLRSAARERGHTASDQETQWQLQRLLDHIGKQA
jgi:hypothetical protein